jgi:hypothetical protein
VKVVNWSPDYDTTQGNSVNITWQQNNPTTPIDLNQAFGGTSNVVNLNNSYSTWLATQNASNIANLKGVGNQKVLLQ